MMTRQITPGAEVLPGVVAWALLGEGPYCATWAAWSTAKWAPVLLKLPLAGADEDRAIAALAREARHLALLHHPAVPRLYELSQRVGDEWLMTELIEGRPLAALLERRPIGTRDTIRLGLQLAAVLRYMHDCELLHLDLKPDNVMVRGGRAFLIDFGATQRVGDPPPAGPRGTDGYMSQEQAAARMPAAKVMDIWSLGVVLLESLTGDRVLELEVRRSFRWRRAPSTLRSTISSMLREDPADRPQTMDVVLRALSCLDTDPARGWAPLIAHGQLGLTTTSGAYPTRSSPEANEPPAERLVPAPTQC